MKLDTIEEGKQYEFVRGHSHNPHSIYKAVVVEIGDPHVLIEYTRDEVKHTEWVSPRRLRIKAGMPHIHNREESKEPVDRGKHRCNLCGRQYKPRNKWMRFCDVCKGRSEVYRFAESI